MSPVGRRRRTLLRRRAAASLALNGALPDTCARRRPAAVLTDLAYNLRWSWAPNSLQLFQSLAPEAWSRAHNPVTVLRAVSDDPARLAEHARATGPPPPISGLPPTCAAPGSGCAGGLPLGPSSPSRNACRSIPAGSASSPATTSRGQRPRLTAVSGGAALPLRLLPPADRRQRLPARELRAARSEAGPTAPPARRGRRALAHRRALPGPTCRPRSGGRRSAACRSTCWTPTSSRIAEDDRWITGHLYGATRTRASARRSCWDCGARLLRAVLPQPSSPRSSI